MASPVATLIGAGSGVSTATPVTASVTQAVPAGSMVVIWVGNRTARTVSTVTDTRGNTYTEAVDTAGAAFIYSEITTALQSGDVVTVTMNASSTTSVAVFTLGTNVAYVAGSGSATSGNAANPSRTTGASVPVDGIVFGGIFWGTSSNLTAPSGWSDAQQATVGSRRFEVHTRAVSSAGSVAYQPGGTGSGSDYAIAVAAFVTEAAGGYTIAADAGSVSIAGTDTTLATGYSVNPDSGNGTETPDISYAQWRLELPVNGSGVESGSTDAAAYDPPYGEYAPYFNHLTAGETEYLVPVKGARRGSTTYPRTEGRELNADGSNASWTINDGKTHRLTGTLKITHLAKETGGDPAKIVFGQIHGPSDELCRLYYDDGAVYFRDDKADNGAGGYAETQFDLVDGLGNPTNIPLGDYFAYGIEVKNGSLNVSVVHDGVTYSASETISAFWPGLSCYFKAGLYLLCGYVGGPASTQGTGHSRLTYSDLEKAHGYVLAADPGSISVAGAAATLTYVPAAENFVLVADAGSITVTGAVAGLRIGWRIAAEVASYSITGQGASLARVRRINAEAGSVATTGGTAGLYRGRLLTAAPGLVSVVASDVTLKRGRRIVAQPGSVTITGADAALIVSSDTNTTLIAEPGFVTVNGADARLLRERRLSAASAAVLILGGNAQLRRGRRIALEPSAVTVAGQSIGLSVTRKIVVLPGVIVITGQDASLRFRPANIRTRTISRPGFTQGGETQRMNVQSHTVRRN